MPMLLAAWQQQLLLAPSLLVIIISTPAARLQNFPPMRAYPKGQNRRRTQSKKPLKVPDAAQTIHHQTNDTKLESYKVEPREELEMPAEVSATTAINLMTTRGRAQRRESGASGKQNNLVIASKSHQLVAVDLEKNPIRLVSQQQQHRAAAQMLTNHHHHPSFNWTQLRLNDIQVSRSESNGFAGHLIQATPTLSSRLMTNFWMGQKEEGSCQTSCWPYQPVQPHQLDYAQQFASLHRLSAVASVIQKNLNLSSRCITRSGQESPSTSTSASAPAPTNSHLLPVMSSRERKLEREAQVASSSIVAPKSSLTQERQYRRRRGSQRKCRKVYGVEQRNLWCTQCKWKKACSRFCDSRIGRRTGSSSRGSTHSAIGTGTGSGTGTGKAAGASLSLVRDA